MTKLVGKHSRAIYLGLALAMASGALMAQPGSSQVTFEPVATPPDGSSTGGGGFPLQLVLDDGGAEGTIGVNGAAARSFLWFNQFTPGLAPPFQIEEIHVLFPTGINMSVGNAVDLVVYLDPDGDPTNGATLLATIPASIQVLDGTSFSVYPLASPVVVDNPGDVLIGVINRWVQGGGDPPTQPAALDTSGSQARSWIAVWSGDPPANPDLPADALFDLIDIVAPPGGNWMIRGFGGPPTVPAMPWIGTLAILLVVLWTGSLWIGRRQRAAGDR